MNAAQARTVYQVRAKASPDGPARIEAAGQTIRQTQALFDLAEQKQAPVRGQHTAIETDIQRLAVDR